MFLDLRFTDIVVCDDGDFKVTIIGVGSDVLVISGHHIVWIIVEFDSVMWIASNLCFKIDSYIFQDLQEWVWWNQIHNQIWDIMFNNDGWFFTNLAGDFVPCYNSEFMDTSFSVNFFGDFSWRFAIDEFNVEEFSLIPKDLVFNFSAGGCLPRDAEFVTKGLWVCFRDVNVINLILNHKFGLKAYSTQTVIAVDAEEIIFRVFNVERIFEFEILELFLGNRLFEVIFVVSEIVLRGAFTIPINWACKVGTNVNVTCQMSFLSCQRCWCCTLQTIQIKHWSQNVDFDNG